MMIRSRGLSPLPFKRTYGGHKSACESVSEGKFTVKVVVSASVTLVSVLFGYSPGIGRNVLMRLIDKLIRKVDEK